MAYPYDAYQASLAPTPNPIFQAYSVGRAGVGLATTALQALDIVKNGGAVPLVAWDPFAPQWQDTTRLIR